MIPTAPNRSPAELIQWGEQAGQLLFNEVFKGVVTDLEARIYAKWKAAPDTATREQMFFEVQALHRIVSTLRADYDSAQLEKSHRDEPED